MKGTIEHYKGEIMKKEKRTSVTLTKKQICFFDEISKNCRFSGGRKLCRTSILRAFITAVKKLDIDVSGITREEDLKRRILESFKRLY